MGPLLWGVGGGWMGVGGGDRVQPTHMHMHAHATHTNAHAHAYDIIGNPRDFPKSNGGGHLHEITMFTMHACACACVCGTPPNHPRPPSTHPPTPKSYRKPKTPKLDNS